MQIATGYTVLDNGTDIALYFPMSAAVVEVNVRADGGAISVRAADGEVVLRDFPSEVTQALQHGSVLLVGVDALARPRYAVDVAAGQRVSVAQGSGHAQ